MTTTTITNFRQNVFEYIRSAIEHNDVIDVTTKDGCAIVMSKEDYDSLMETLYLTNIPGMTERLIEAKNTKPEDMVPLEEIEW